MPYRCCVPLCKGNYPNGPKVSVFGFPKDVELKKHWLSAIQRKDFSPSANSRVSVKSILLIFIHHIQI